MTDVKPRWRLMKHSTSTSSGETNVVGAARRPRQAVGLRVDHEELGSRQRMVQIDHPEVLSPPPDGPQDNVQGFPPCRGLECLAEPSAQEVG